MRTLTLTVCEELAEALALHQIDPEPVVRRALAYEVTLRRLDVVGARAELLLAKYRSPPPGPLPEVVMENTEEARTSSLDMGPLLESWL